MEDQEQPKQPEELNKHSSRPSHTEDLVDHYWGSMNYVFGLIKASEIKAGLILSFYGILLNFIFQNMALALARLSADLPIYVLFGFWFLCTVGSIYSSIRCFMPRIEASYDKNVFFFRDVVSKFGTIKEFSSTFYKISLDEVALFDQMGQQIFIISKIAALKFKHVNRSLKLLALGLLFLLIMVLYYFLAIIF